MRPRMKISFTWMVKSEVLIIKGGSVILYSVSSVSTTGQHGQGIGAELGGISLTSLAYFISSLNSVFWNNKLCFVLYLVLVAFVLRQYIFCRNTLVLS